MTEIDRIVEVEGISFVVAPDGEGGYTASAREHSILIEAGTLEALREAACEAARLHLDADGPHS